MGKIYNLVHDSFSGGQFPYFVVQDGNYNQSYHGYTLVARGSYGKISQLYDNKIYNWDNN